MPDRFEPVLGSRRGVVRHDELSAIADALVVLNRDPHGGVEEMNVALAPAGLRVGRTHPLYGYVVERLSGSRRRAGYLRPRPYGNTPGDVRATLATGGRPWSFADFASMHHQ